MRRQPDTEAPLDHGAKVDAAPAHPPSVAGSGPVSTIVAGSRGCSSVNRGRRPGTGRFESPASPSALERWTRSSGQLSPGQLPDPPHRRVWRSMPALRAASVRLFPSSTNAGAGIPRDARTSVARTASRRSSDAESSVRVIPTATTILLASQDVTHSPTDMGTVPKVRASCRWYKMECLVTQARHGKIAPAPPLRRKHSGRARAGLVWGRAPP